MTATHSVIIPVLNGARYIEACLDSVLSQIGPGDELIVVDNGSTDDTVTIVGRHADRGVTLLHEPKRGPAAARNTGLRHATGAYVSFVDSDDLWPQDRLANMMALLDAAPEADAVYGRVQLRVENGEERLNSLQDTHAPLVGLWCYIFRRRILDRAGPMDEELLMAEDVDYLLRLRTVGMTCAVYDGPAIIYRRHDAQLTHRQEQVGRSHLVLMAQRIKKSREAR